MIRLKQHNRRKLNSRGGWSLLEVLVSLVVLMVGVLSVALYFPKSVESKAEAGYLAKAVLLAERKAHEIRRDNDLANSLINEIQTLASPTDPIPFPEVPNLSYQFYNASLIDTVDDANDNRDDIGIARIIVRYSADFRTSQEIIYELRFGQ